MINMGTKELLVSEIREWKCKVMKKGKKKIAVDFHFSNFDRLGNPNCSGY